MTKYIYKLITSLVLITSFVQAMDECTAKSEVEKKFIKQMIQCFKSEKTADSSSLEKCLGVVSENMNKRTFSEWQEGKKRLSDFGVDTRKLAKKAMQHMIKWGFKEFHEINWRETFQHCQNLSMQLQSFADKNYSDDYSYGDISKYRYKVSKIELISWCYSLLEDLNEHENTGIISLGESKKELNERMNSSYERWKYAVDEFEEEQKK